VCPGPGWYRRDDATLLPFIQEGVLQGIRRPITSDTIMGNLWGHRLANLPQGYQPLITVTVINTYVLSIQKLGQIQTIEGHWALPKTQIQCNEWHI